MRLRVVNRSNDVVRTTEGFSQTEFPRLLLFTDPVGIAKGTVNPIGVERYVVPTQCFVRNGVLQRPTAIPVVPIEILPTTFGQEYVFDARALYDLILPGRYSVVAQIPLLTFTLADQAAIITDCDDVPGTLVHVGDEQTASVPPLSGQAFTIVSNGLEFVVAALPTVTVAATTATATEAGLVPGAFTVSRTGSTAAALPVAYTVAGTATPGSDYAALAGSVTIPAGATSATITVTPINDTVVEGAETVVLTLVANAAYTVGTPNNATVTILSDDVAALPTVSVAATTPRATEARLVPGAFTVSRTGSTAAALSVAYTVAGTATPGSDYAALAGSVTIPAGQTSALIAVTPLQDTLVEPDETVILTLVANAAYTVGTPNNATVTILSDDVAGFYFGGFGFPLKNDSDCAQVPCKTFRRGRPLPVRFWLFDANHAIVTNATPHIVVTQVSPTPPAQPPEDLGLGPSDSGDVFRYNRLTRQYVFFLDTRGLKVGVWRIDVRLGDAIIGSVHFGLR
jgi:hypothetical protein